MNTSVLQCIQNAKAKVVIFDIDGTLKDLCKEHSIALRKTLKECNVGDIRKNLILFINKIAMLMVKTGLFSTNNRKQKFLIKVFAILCGKKINTFSSKYFKNYTEQVCLFSYTCELLGLINNEKIVYFSTINEQNYNMEEYGIPQERIIYTKGYSKVSTYNKILKDIGANKKDTIIVGDNIFDDLFSAKLLGVNCLLVNNYNSKLKSIVCKFVNGKYLK